MELMISRTGDGEHFTRDHRDVTIRLDLPQLSVHEIEFDHAFEVPEHRHDNVDALYVLAGTVEFLSAGFATPARAKRASSSYTHRTVASLTASEQLIHHQRNGTGMSKLFIFITEHTVKYGRLEDLAAMNADFVEFVDANEPRVLR